MKKYTNTNARSDTRLQMKELSGFFHDLSEDEMQKIQGGECEDGGILVNEGSAEYREDGEIISEAVTSDFDLPWETGGSCDVIKN